MSKKLKNKITYVPTYILNNHVLPISTSFEELDRMV
jgi:hypothetical protein